MSINNIISTIEPAVKVPPYYGFQEVKYRDVLVDGQIYAREDNFNRENYTLQCYEPNKARFLPQPVLNDLNHDVFNIFQDPAGENELDEYFSFDAPAAEDNFELVVGTDKEILCIADGMYWVTIKVSKANGTFVLRTELEVNDVRINISITSTPYVSGARNYNTNFCSILLRLQEDDVIKLFRSYFPADSTLELSDPIEVSSITFIKINADIP